MVINMVAGGGGGGGIQLSSIAITSQPTKTSYTVGENLDLTGVVVTATYSNGLTQDVTDFCVFSPVEGTELDTEGTVRVTASYTESGATKTDSFDVTVIAQTQTHNTTYLYYLGDEYEDVTGGWVKPTNVTMAGFTKYADRFELIKASGNTAGALMTNNAFNFTAYERLFFGFEYSENTAASEPVGVRIGYATSKKYPIFEKPSLHGGASVLYKGVSSKTVHGIDLSGINNSYNPEFSFNIQADRIGYMKVYAAMLAKSDDISGLSDFGSTIQQIISNSDTLLQNESAVDYMIYNCTGDFMWSALADATFIERLDNSPYYDTIYDNEEWGKALAVVMPRRTYLYKDGDE